MIKVKKISLSLEGEWFEFPVENITISLKIRPLFYDIGKYIETRNKRITFHKFREKEKIDWEGFARDQLDYLLEDFKGVGYDYDMPIHATIQTKRKLVEQIKGCLDFILKKSEELRNERILGAIEKED